MTSEPVGDDRITREEFLAYERVRRSGVTCGMVYHLIAGLVVAGYRPVSITRVN